ncbi:MAG: hypothetical protein ABW194_11545 [Novosphingobium sp.]
MAAILSDLRVNAREYAEHFGFGLLLGTMAAGPMLFAASLL